MKRRKLKILLGIAGVVLLLSHAVLYHYTEYTIFNGFMNGILVGAGIVLLIGAVAIRKDNSA